MEAMTKTVDWSKVGDAWAALEGELGPINFSFSSANADHIAAVIDSLLEATSVVNAPATLLRLLDVLSEWISEYERAHVETSHASPAEVLKQLMESNDLRQKDLAPLFGGQSVVSAVLSGKRDINARQALALGERFRISPLVFMSVAPAAAPVATAYFAQETGPEAKEYRAFIQLGSIGEVRAALSTNGSEIIYVATP
jgi:HTH-type transcriptional regulator / antitoxin HigA